MSTFSFKHLILKAVTPILVSTAACLPSAHAGNKPRVAFDQYDKALAMAQRLQKTHDIPATQTLDLLKQAQYLPNVAEAVKPPKLKTVRNWDNYRARFVEPYRILKGVEFWNSNAEILNQAQTQYGIPQEIIVAIIGIETIYGQHIGNYRVLDSLSTLGFAYPQGQKDRSDFFVKELESFIALCKTMALDPEAIKGSYAGAIGLGQFMPSSWLNFAVDGDQDGKVDLFHSKQDAIFSVANFLRIHGWETGKAARIFVDIENTANLSELLAPDIIPTFTPSMLEEKGVKLKGTAQAQEKLALIELMRGEAEPAFVAGGQNFYVITRYNRSSFYANAVLELGEALKLKKHSTDAP